MLSNATLRRGDLSAKSLAILVVLLSFDSKWQITISGTASFFSDGVTAIRSAFDELIEAGYLTVLSDRNKGRFGRCFRICESANAIPPKPESEPTPEPIPIPEPIPEPTCESSPSPAPIADPLPDFPACFDKQQRVNTLKIFKSKGLDKTGIHAVLTVLLDYKSIRNPLGLVTNLVTCYQQGNLSLPAKKPPMNNNKVKQISLAVAKASDAGLARMLALAAKLSS